MLLAESMGIQLTYMGNSSKKPRIFSSSASNTPNRQDRLTYTCKSTRTCIIVPRKKREAPKQDPQHRRQREPLPKPHPEDQTTRRAGLPRTRPAILDRSQRWPNVHQPPRWTRANAAAVHPRQSRIPSQLREPTISPWGWISATK